MRRFLTTILLFGLTGSGIELMLLNHHEDLKQVIPLALIGLGFVALLWIAVSGSRTAVWGLRALMSLFVLAGLLGVALHFQSTLEFQQEIDPSLRGFDLVMKALRAKAPPALAPGVMVQLGLIGLALTYRHPSLGLAQSQDRNHGE